MRPRVYSAVALALWLAMIGNAHAASSTGWDSAQRLLRAAFFSDACRQAAESLGVIPISDPNALFAALATSGRHLTSVAGRSGTWRDDCKLPAVLLINLFRLNGVDAELVLASMTPACAADSVPSDRIDRVLVYVTTLGRYLDPAAPLAKQPVLDQIIRERAKRAHFQGPTLAAGARDACPDLCMHVYHPRREHTVVVKTEAVRGR